MLRPDFQAALSSAKIDELVPRSAGVGRSLIMMLNSSGLMTLPCGVPFSIALGAGQGHDVLVRRRVPDPHPDRSVAEKIPDVAEHRTADPQSSKLVQQSFFPDHVERLGKV